ncbi:hypothetical protein Pmani_014392 [Petrolisthes manimaculis]|uniref:Uncharacterized protein n=1 Tax=Petrolisthes manimaculis TaxID=1843537 RepID=A0AAE1PVT7_9EUCA|nr:hypothetical protein Pmani_014392 [Petrolisthes manimaculis]
MANIKAGFRKCRIIPFNPNAVDKTLLMRNKLIPNIDVDLSEPPAQAFVTTGTPTDDPLQGVLNVPVPHVTPSTQTDDPPQDVPNVPVPQVKLPTQTNKPPLGVHDVVMAAKFVITRPIRLVISIY